MRLKFCLSDCGDVGQRAIQLLFIVAGRAEADGFIYIGHGEAISAALRASYIEYGLDWREGFVVIQEG